MLREFYILGDDCDVANGGLGAQLYTNYILRGFYISGNDCDVANGGLGAQLYTWSDYILGPSGKMYIQKTILG